MRKGCERRRLNKVGIVDRANYLGAMAEAAAPELFVGDYRGGFSDL